jgi:hypothetical protein
MTMEQIPDSRVERARGTASGTTCCTHSGTRFGTEFGATLRDLLARARGSVLRGALGSVLRGTRVIALLAAALIAVALFGGWAPAAGAAPLRAAAALKAAAPLVRIPQPHEGRAASAGTSTNWSGYSATGAVFTSVTATWTQPAVAADISTDRIAAFWVGLDGDLSATVEQIGTLGASQGGKVRYFAWYEMFPADIVYLHLAIHPGDQLTGTVVSTGPGGFTLSLVNHTTGHSFITSQQESAQYPAQLDSAEVIAETPSDSTGVLPLATFGIVTFSACAFNGQPISAFDWESITLASAADGTPLAIPSALNADGTGFFVSDDFTAPVTTVRGAGRFWHDTPVKLRFTATDGAFSSGVAATEYSLDGGVTWITGTTVTVSAPADHSNDGVHPVLYRSTDKAGNVEDARGLKVGIDTQRPTPLAASPASVRRGHTAKLRYSVSDPRPGPRTATVTIRVRTASGRVVKMAVLKRRAVNTALRYGFLCTLPRGTYRFSVYATDAAGNVQTAAASNTLVVR